MRIFILNSAPEYHWDDRDFWLWHLAKALQEHGHQVWCCGRPQSPFLEHCQQSGLPTCAMVIRSDISPITITRLALMFRQHQVDVVVGNFTKDIRLAGLAGKFSGGPKILAYHGLPVIKDNWRYKITYQQLVDAIVVNTSATQQVYQQVPWLKAVPLKVIPPGVTMPVPSPATEADIRRRFDLPDKHPVLGQFGYLGHYKQPFIFLEVARKILETWPEAIFLMVGMGPLREEILKYAYQLNVLDHLYLFSNADDVPALLQLCDVVLFTPEVEGIPSSLLQAMAQEKAVLAFEVGGLGDVIEPEVNGVLVPVNDIFQMAQRTQELLLSPEQRHRLGKAARQKVEKNFSFEKSIHSFESYLQELIGTKKGG